MRRHSKAAGEPLKTRRRKTGALKRRNAPKAVRLSGSSTASPETKVAQPHERDEALEQQAATADVLKIISRSNFDLQTVFDTLVESAMRLCESDAATIWLPEGNVLKVATQRGFSPEFEEFAKQNPIVPGRDTVSGRVALEGRAIHIPDILGDPDLGSQYLLRGRYRSAIGVPLLRDGETIGVFVLTRSELKPFTDKQIALVQNFASQAVIAIENTRLLNELRQSLQQQTATADVLKVISRSTFDLKAVLDTLVQSAVRLCEADMAAIHQQQGTRYQEVATHGFPRNYRQFVLANLPFEAARGSVLGRIVHERRMIHVSDVLADPEYTMLEAQRRAGFRTVLGVPLLREGSPVGAIVLMRKVVRPFTDKQIELATTFADQAVIAIENTRLLNELRERTSDLTESLEQQTGTSEILGSISSSPTDVRPVLNTIVSTAVSLCNSHDAVILLKEGERLRVEAHYGPMELDFQGAPIARDWVSGRAVVDGMPVHVHDLTVEDTEFPLGSKIARRLNQRTVLGLPLLREGQAIGCLFLRRTEVLPFSEKQIALLRTFADQAVIAIENVRLFEAEQRRTRELATSLEDLRTAQDRLVQTQKLASLGQLTAGIAHEIKNPLNFVNNFSGVSVELIAELKETLGQVQADERTRADIDDLANTLRDNLDKIVQHGKRADAIVKNMLLHSREGSGEHRLVDINAIVEESLNLAYHGARAEKEGFNITLERSFDPTAGQVDLFPQDISRVLLNLISNGFYAATKRGEQAGYAGYEPTVAATTKNLGEKVEIRIRDNGTGIPPEVKDKIFNPFFTTKPVGEGTGLGLSISHDIIVKQHGGSIEVDTRPDEFTEIRIVLPRATS